MLLIVFAYKFVPEISGGRQALAFMNLDAKPKPDQVWRTDVVDVKSPASLEARTPAGSVYVTSHDRSEIIVQTIVTLRGRPIAEGDKAPVSLSVDKKGNHVTVHAEVENRVGRSNPSISYRIYVPVETSVVSHTAGGSMTAKNLNGDVELKTSGGRIFVSKIKGDVDVSTSGGPITITGSSGHLKARTSGGVISLTDSDGSMDVRTSGGSLELKNLSGSLEAITSGGAISARIIHISDYLKLSTSGGAIHVELPDNQGLDIRASGSSVHSDLKHFSGSHSRNSLTGTVLDGGIPVDIRTPGGSVRLRHGQ